MFKESRNILFTVLVIIVLLGIAAWFAQQEIENSMRDDMEASLQTVLDTTHQSIQTWVKEERSSVLIWANTPEVRQFTNALLATTRTRETLISAPAQTDLRHWIRSVQAVKKYQGYFIISKDGISLASSLEDNIGTENLLVTQKTFLQKILAGKTALSLPLRSDVPLLNSTGQLQKDLPTMFIGAPITDDNGTIKAVFVFRIDPREDFTKILQRGQIGKAGETYAFNSDGQLISDSRFESQLHALGLLQPDQPSILNIQIRQPGNSIARGLKESGDEAQQPLTLMAKQATQGRAGQNLYGYLDYRGKPVVGVWLWDADLNFGITTEVDRDEAYATLKLVQSILYALTLLSVLLLAVLGAYFIVSRKRILESEQRFSGIVQMADEAIISIDEAQNITLINKAAEAIFGYTAEELLGKKLNMIIPLKYREAHHKYVENFLASAEEMVAREARLPINGLRKSGEVIPMEASISKQTVADRVVMTVAARDISARVEAEQEKEQLQQHLLQAQKMDAIGQLTGGIAHEFNNLLASIQGFTEMAKAAVVSKNTAKAPDYLDEVLRSSKRASDLVAKMLAYTRGGKQELKLQALPPVIHDSLNMLKPLLPSSIIITTKIEEDLPDVMVDAVLLGSVIVNLCVNARDAMQEKGQIDIQLHHTQWNSTMCHSCHNTFDGSYVELSVADTGSGIESDVLARIFDPFFTTKDVGKGTGMGLSMLHGIVHDHHGHILIESMPGKGTTFRILFPINE